MTRVGRVAARLAFVLAASASASAPPLEVAVSRSGGEWTAGRGARDPRAAIASLFTRAGVAYALGEDGTPRLR